MPLDFDEHKYLITSLGAVVLMALSSYASCSAITQSSVHAIPLANKKSVITNSYIAVIMGSTIFVYALILCTLIINKISTTMTVNESMCHFGAGVMFGSSAYFSGIAFGEVCKKCYLTLEKREGFYIIFICTLSAVELVTLFGFLISLFLILK